MSTTFTYDVRNGDKVRNMRATLAGKVGEYTEQDLINHFEKCDPHRSPDEISNIQIVSHDSKPVLPPEGLAADVSGSDLKASRGLVNAAPVKKTVYKLADGTDATPGKGGEVTEGNEPAATVPVDPKA